MPLSRDIDVDANLTSPAVRVAVVTPSDSTPIKATRSLYVGVAGDLTVVMADDPTATPVLFKAAANGYHPLRVVKVMAVTAATNILALW